MFINLPESRTILSQGVQDGVCDVGTARHTQRLQMVTTPANGDESLICDLLFTQRQSARVWGHCGKTDMTRLCSWRLALHNCALLRVEDVGQESPEGVMTCRATIRCDDSDITCSIPFSTNIFKRWDLTDKRQEQSMNDTHVCRIMQQACRIVAYWILLSPPCEYLFSGHNFSLSAQVYSSCFKEGIVLLNQSFFHLLLFQLRYNSGLKGLHCSGSFYSCFGWLC